MKFFGCMIEEKKKFYIILKNLRFEPYNLKSILAYKSFFSILIFLKKIVRFIHPHPILIRDVENYPEQTYNFLIMFSWLYAAARCLDAAEEIPFPKLRNIWKMYQNSVKA